MNQFIGNMTYAKALQEFVKVKFSDQEWNLITMSKRMQLVRALLKAGLLTPEGLKKVTIKGMSPCPYLVI